MPIVKNIISPDKLLEAAYKNLGFESGNLLAPSKYPTDQNESQWVERGDWLFLTSQHQLKGVERIFFVDQQPVVGFAKSDENNVDVLRSLYNSVWSMARPRLLFLATPGEISVYDLGQSPIEKDEEIHRSKGFLDKAETIAEVQSKLHIYHRERIESGALFEEERFGNGLNRADRALIRDLKIVLKELKSIKGIRQPEPRYLHALIGRAIFIRYLEDREIIGIDYYKKVADKNDKWKSLLDEPIEKPLLGSTLNNQKFF